MNTRTHVINGMKFRETYSSRGQIIHYVNGKRVAWTAYIKAMGEAKEAKKSGEKEKGA
jgi:hypothetical protein